MRLVKGSRIASADRLPWPGTQLLASRLRLACRIWFVLRPRSQRGASKTLSTRCRLRRPVHHAPAQWRDGAVVGGAPAGRPGAQLRGSRGGYEPPGWSPARPAGSGAMVATIRRSAVGRGFGHRLAPWVMQCLVRGPIYCPTPRVQPTWGRFGRLRPGRVAAWSETGFGLQGGAVFLAGSGFWVIHSALRDWHPDQILAYNRQYVR